MEGARPPGQDLRAAGGWFVGGVSVQALRGQQLPPASNTAPGSWSVPGEHVLVVRQPLVSGAQ